MSATKPPPLLVDSNETSDALRSALQAAHDYRPDAVQMAALANRLGSALDAPLSTGSGAASGLALKVVVGVTIVGIVAGLAAWLWSARDPAPVRTVAPRPSASWSTEPLPVVPARTSVVSPPTTPIAEHAPTASAHRADQDPGKSPPDSIPSQERGPRSASPGTPALPVPPSESELLERARMSLRSDPSGALSWARQHERRYPRGLLVQEREVLVIEALSRVGRGAEARARAERFLRRHPTSAHRQRLGRLLSPRSSPP